MCGITGYWARNADPRAWLRDLHRSIRSLRARGPDDQGAWVREGDEVAFGHTRLSILDLSTAGRQPMVAADGDFVLAFYNPASKARPDQIGRAFEVLRRQAGERIVVLAKAVGRPDEEIILTSLSAVKPEEVDMRTLVLIGSSQTRLIERGEAEPWIYSPRRWDA